MNHKLNELASDLSIAAESAAIKARIETAEKRAKANCENFSSSIISTLKAGGIPQAEIDSLTESATSAIRFNNALTRLLTSSAKALSILKSII
ncbi:MAG: hypothetical protein NC453_25990 [Muribaculum sp.]|nr:hypothetical protein [Muribaculum sp.]